jgi:3-dehydroquinate dehydratase-2
LGIREPEIYGAETLADHVASAENAAKRFRLRIEHVQSNHEGELVDAVHANRTRATGMIVNGGAFTHYSWALHDALASFDGPVIELHISNPGAREEFRHRSVLSSVSTAVIAGLGAAGYPLAVQAMAGLLGRPESESGPA